jgi:hypothetical protein
MKMKANLESAVYAFVIILSLITLFLVLCSDTLFNNIKIVYEMF